MTKHFTIVLLSCLLFIFNTSLFAQRTNQLMFKPQKFDDNFCLIKTSCKTMKEANELGKFIGEKGGRVAVIGTQRLILAWIPFRIENSIRQNKAVLGIERKRQNTNVANKDDKAIFTYFNSVLTGELEKKDRENRVMNGRMDTLGCIMSKDKNHGSKHRVGAPDNISPMSICDEDNNSEYMVGTVSVGVFFVESDGSIDADTYTWTESAIINMKAQIVDALSIWSYTASQNSQSVSFTPVWYSDTSLVDTPYEPIDHASSEDELYINHIMNNLGYNLGDKFSNTSAYNYDLKINNGTDWSFSSFVIYNPTPAPDLMTDNRGSYAYLGGPYMHVLFRYFGWTVANFYRTFGHEVGHIFHAFDEYSSAPSVLCDYEFNGIKNSNYNGSTCNGSATCVMINNSFTSSGATRKWNMCNPTKSHIGWQDVNHAAQSLVPADNAVETDGNIDFSWDRNTLNTDINSILRIYDTSNAVVFCQNLGNTNQYSYFLPDGQYYWQVLQAKYSYSAGFAEISSPIHSLSVGCTNVNISSEANDSIILENQDATFGIVAGGTGPLSYKWQVNTGSSWADISIAGTNPVYSGYNTDTLALSGVGSGNNGNLYRCIVTSSCDATGDTSQTVTLTVCKNLGLTTVNGSTSACENTYEYYSASCDGASTFTWTVPLGCVIDSGQGTANIKVQMAAGSGQICVTPSNACSTGSSECVNVIINTKPVASVTPSGALTFCQGDSVTLSASLAQNYSWSNGKTTSSIVVKTSGNYTVRISDINSCKDTSVASAVIVHSTTSSITAGGSTNICQGNSVTLTASKASSYVWSTLETTRSILVSSAGNYVVQTTDSNTCVVSSAPTTVQVFLPIPKSNPINGLTVSCLNNSTNYFLSPVTNASTYTWTVPNGSTINSGQGSIKMNVTFGSNSGSVCVVASNGCMSTPPSCKYVNIGTPATPGSITGSTNFCTGGKTNVPYSVAAVAGAQSYVWTLSAGDNITQGSGTRSIQASFTNNSSTVCVKTSNTCGVSNDKCINVSTTPPVSNKSIIGSANVCYAGTSNVNYSLSSLVGSSSFVWTPPAGASVTAGQGTGVVSISYGNGFTSGLLCVQALNLCNVAPTNNCKLISDAPLIFNNVGGLATVAPNTANVVYSIGVSNGATSYTWTVPNGVNITSGQGTNSVTLHFTGSFTGGTVCVTANNACGSSTSKCKQVNPN